MHQQEKRQRIGDPRPPQACGPSRDDARELMPPPARGVGGRIGNQGIEGGGPGINWAETKPPPPSMPGPPLALERASRPLAPPPMFLAAGGMNMIVDMMQHSDPSNQRQAAQVVFEACTDDPQNQQLVNDAGGVSKIVELLKKGNNPEVKKTAAVAIAAACAQNRDNRLEALNANALEPLVEMLEGRDAQTQQSAANALANVIIPRTGNSADTELDANAPHSDHSYEREEIGEGQNKVKELGGVTKLINLVDSGAPRVKEAAAAAIANAMVDNQANRQAFVEAGGVGPLIDLVQSGDPAAQEHATTALWNAMVDNEQSKVDLINHPQGLQVLVQVLLSGTEVTQESAAGAIWKACVADPSIKDRLFVAIPGLVQLLKHGSPGARLQAAGALRTACINNVANKKQLNLVGGIAALVRPCSAPPLAHPPCTRLPLLPAFTLCS
jgi:HEAT repeat protein